VLSFKVVSTKSCKYHSSIVVEPKKNPSVGVKFNFSVLILPDLKSSSGKDFMY